MNGQYQVEEVRDEKGLHALIVRSPQGPVTFFDLTVDPPRRFDYSSMDGGEPPFVQVLDGKVS